MELFPFPEDLGPLHLGHVLEAGLHQPAGMHACVPKAKVLTFPAKLLLVGRNIAPLTSFVQFR